MHFVLLHARLVAHIRGRVQSGELTERGLARLTGVSQPHLHNVLKGVRALSMVTADRILKRLEISALDLVDSDTWVAHGRRHGDALGYAEVPLLRGLIGPGHPFPAREDRRGRFPFPRAGLDGLTQPAAARVGADAGVRGLFRAGDVVLLDRNEASRETPAPESYYAVNTGEGGLIRLAQRQGDVLWLSPGGGPDAPEDGVSISLADRHILEVVKAKVVWIGHYLEPCPIAARQTEEAGEED